MEEKTNNMKLISNQIGQVHAQTLIQLIKQSDEIIICVAFLKSSGLNLIIDELKYKNFNCTFYIGTDYYLTEPKAIRELIKQGHNIYKVHKASSTYHPKIYYFKKGNAITILIGSANMTGGGLVNNYELSFLFETTTNSTIDKDFKSIIDNYSKSSEDFNDELLISQYESDYEKYRQKHKKADKEFNEEKNKTHKFDLTKLPQYIAEYNANKEKVAEFEDRTFRYKTALKLLNKVTQVEISSPNQFLEYYDIIAKSYLSSGLLRGKTKFAEKYKIVLSIFKLVQQNKNAEPKILFDKALPLVQSVKKFGINALTELMNTYNPNKYAIANGRTLKSLANLDFQKFPASNNFNAKTYENYNNLISAIAKHFKLENLGHVDHFLSWYYDKYVKKLKPKTK